MWNLKFNAIKDDEMFLGELNLNNNNNLAVAFSRPEGVGLS
jgi:hypothetical protein